MQSNVADFYMLDVRVRDTAHEYSVDYTLQQIGVYHTPPKITC